MKTGMNETLQEKKASSSPPAAKHQHLQQIILHVIRIKLRQAHFVDFFYLFLWLIYLSVFNGKGGFDINFSVIFILDPRLSTLMTEVTAVII